MSLMSVMPRKQNGVSASPSDSVDAATHAGGSAEDKIANELSRGVTLDGGPVVDFASVKDAASRAERALAASRRRYEASLDRGDGTGAPAEGTAGRLMGVNDEVVAEVGREIGAFVAEYAGDGAAGGTTAAVVQECARRIRAVSFVNGSRCFSAIL